MKVASRPAGGHALNVDVLSGPHKYRQDSGPPPSHSVGPSGSRPDTAAANAAPKGITWRPGRLHGRGEPLLDFAALSRARAGGLERDGLLASGNALCARNARGRADLLDAWAQVVLDDHDRTSSTIASPRG